jgi:hypothetical protein
MGRIAEKLVGIPGDRNACVSACKSEHLRHVRGRRVVRGSRAWTEISRGKIVESMAASAMRVHAAGQAWPRLVSFVHFPS